VGAASFGAKLKELVRRFPGREIVLIEGWVRRGDALCCPSIIKRSYYRYDATRDRYTRYKARIQRLKRPGGADLDASAAG
jgi:hypothetical protein